MLFDCFNTVKPRGFDNDFFPVCLGNETFTDEQGRKYETLPKLLEGSASGSILLKIDIEGSEIEVMQTLADIDFTKLRSLSIEFHLNQHDPFTKVTPLNHHLRIMEIIR